MSVDVPQPNGHTFGWNEEVGAFRMTCYCYCGKEVVTYDEYPTRGSKPPRKVRRESWDDHMRTHLK